MNRPSRNQQRISRTGRAGTSLRLSIALGFLAAGAAHAQEALRSAVMLDRSLANYQGAPVDLRPDASHLGPVEFSLGVYTGVTGDSNINLSENDPQSDTSIGVGLNLGLVWAPTGRSELRFGTSFGYSYYVNKNRDNGFNITPDSALTYAITLDEVTVTLFDQFSYTQNPNTDAALANVSSLGQIDNTVGARVSWDPNQWTLQASYSHNTYLSNDEGADYLNRSSEYLFGRVGWRFAEATQAGLEVSSTVTDYKSAVQNDYIRTSVGAYVETQLRPSINLALRGGPSFTMFDSSIDTAGGTTLSTYYLGLNATHQLTDFLSHRLSMVRDVQPSLNQGSAYIEQFTANYAISWALTQWIGLGASLTFEKGEQPLPISLQGGGRVESLEEFSRYGGGLSASWRATDHLAVSVSYQYWARESNLPARGYTDNVISLNLAYTF